VLTFVIENVRSLFKRQEIEVRPLTIVTGENSSGKSTFLALVSTICDTLTFPFAPTFNAPPYSLGTFDTIASFRGGRGGRAKSFTIGYKDSAPRSNAMRSVLAS
jgi:hypothetical protein